MGSWAVITVRWIASLDEAESRILNLLPNTIRRNLVQEARGPYVLKHPVFLALREYSSRSFERVVCDVLVPHFYQMEASIFTYGEVAQNMVFVLGGQLTYRKYSQALISLLDQVCVVVSLTPALPGM